MKALFAKSKNNRNFTLQNEEGDIFGEIKYEKWYSTEADIVINEKKYHVKNKGFWTTALEVYEIEKILLKFKMDWRSNIVMVSFLQNEKHYIIKRESFFSPILVMYNEEGKIFLKLKRTFKWKEFRYYYEIALLEELEYVEILSLVHVVNYFHSQNDDITTTTSSASMM